MPPHPLASLSLLPIALVAAADLHAQRLTGTILGNVSGALFGGSIAAAPDRSGDGPDLLVGMPGWALNTGRAAWLNGQGGQPLSIAFGPNALSRFGITLTAAGDLNGDQIPDWVAGAPGASQSGPESGMVAAVSGATGLLLWTRTGAATHRMGSAVVALPDLDGDGRQEIAVSSPGVDIGNVSVMSGANGWTLRVYSGDPFGGFGAAVALLRPVGSGPARLIVGEPLWSGGRGRLWLIDPTQPAAAAAVWFVDGNHGDYLGEQVARLGDVSGDGLPDLLASRRNGRVDVRSGATGAVLTTLSGASSNEFGAAFCGAGDLDGDGKPEIAIGAPATNQNEGAVVVYSGQGFGQLFALRGTTGSRFGEAVAGVGDLDGDGFGDLAVGAPLHQEPGLGAVGRVTMHALRIQGSATPYGTGCSGNLSQVPDLSVDQPPRLSAAFQLRIRQAPANTLCLFAQGLSDQYLGTTPLPFDLGPLGAPNCSVRNSAEAVTVAPTNSSGTGTMVIQVPNDPVLAGLSYHAQGIVLAPAANALGLATSAGLALRIGHP